MKIVIKFTNIILNIVSLFISLFIPKTDKIWIFGSWFGKNFSDNTKYLFLYCNKYKQELGLDKVIWITSSIQIYNELKENGFIVYKKWSFKSIWYHMRAKRHFICQVPDDINPYFSARSKRIQLWHGVGLKKLSYIDQIPDSRNIKYKIVNLIKYISSKGFWHNYIFLSTSQFATENIFKYSFELWRNKYFEANYPRNIYLNKLKIEDYYLNENQIKIIDYIKKQKENNKVKILLYMPTYRDKKNINYPLNIDSKEKLSDIINYFKQNGIIFLNKLHFIEEKEIYSDNYFINLEPTLDIYPILKYIDILITDYSSVYADFLFMNKAIIFYPYDFEYYKMNDKGFLLEYEKFITGDVALDIDSLIKYIDINLKLDKYESKRNKIKNIYFGENSEETMLDFINKVKRI